MNFLLSQTSKINPRIFYIDAMRSSEVFINAMGGKYYRISPGLKEKDKLNINPFMIDNTPENEKFLNEFIINLVGFQDDGFMEMGQTETQLKLQYKHIPNIVKQILAMDKQNKTFENVAKLFDKKETNLIYSKLAFWYKKENISFIFNHSSNDEFNDRIIGISLKTIVENENLVVPVVNYLFHIIKQLANGEPFILAIDDAWDIVNNDIIAPKFFDILTTLPNKNVAIVATTSGTNKLSKSAITKPVNNFFATELYLANPKVSLYQKKVFSLQEEESRMLALMRLEDRNFLLKCIGDVVISSINLKTFNFYTNIFSNDNVSINAMYKAKDISKSDNIEVWIPVFLKIMEEYKKAIRQKQMKENEINQLKWEEARNDENTRNKIVHNG